jgi:putative toxin-antitoxin system antitoxin component (TIGR02293 family)
MRMARIVSLAKQVFGDEAKAGSWLRKPKASFAQRAPLEMLITEADARLVEEMLLQLDHGFVA